MMDGLCEDGCSDFDPMEEEGAGGFQWDPQQRQALDKIEAWRASRYQQIFRLFGYAGTGKTTLTKEVARRVGGSRRWPPFKQLRMMVVIFGSTLPRPLPLPKPKPKLKPLKDADPASEDSVIQWCKERIERREGRKLRAGAALADYEAWCQIHGANALPVQTFGKVMKEKRLASVKAQAALSGPRISMSR